MSNLPSLSRFHPDFESLAQLSRDLLWVFDAAGRCRWVSPSVQAILGYPPADCLERPLTQWVHPEDVAASQQQLEIALTQGRSVSFENRCRCREGRWQTLMWTISPVHQEECHWLYCLAQPLLSALADRAQVEAAQTDISMYVSAIHNIPVGIYIWRLDDLADVRSFRLIATNRAATQATGVAMEGLLNRAMAETFPKLFETDIPLAYADVVRTGTRRNLGEMTYADQRVQPSIFAVQAFPLPNQCVGVAFENITDRKRDEQLRRQGEEQLRIIFQEAGVGMARVAISGRWIQVNQKLCQLLGYQDTELCQLTFDHIIHPDDHALDQAYYQQLLAQPNGLTQEKRCLRKDGSTVWVELTGSLVKDDQGQPGYFIAVISDVTQRKQSELKLQRQKDELMQINRRLAHTTATLERRNQELDQFAYVASHDLKAPLRAIANLAAWIEEDLTDTLPPENKRQLDLLQGRIHRMEGLIDGLLRYSRVGRERQPVETVPVAALLAEVIDSLAPPAGVTVEIVTPMPTLQTQRLPLRQVFANLISNAIKHRDRPEGRVQIAAVEQDDWYEFSVTDDGPGIAAAYHSKIFTIFQTLVARDKSDHTGIGLSIVKKSVEAEGGEITVESAEGEGATFRFTWPKQSA